MQSSDRLARLESKALKALNVEGANERPVRQACRVRACAALVFCLMTAGASQAQTLTTLYSFCSQSKCDDGASPAAPLIQATSGGLYGTTFSGGSRGGGTLFRISTGGRLDKLHNFCTVGDCTDGFWPDSALVVGADGEFYGTTNSSGSPSGGAFFKVTLDGDLSVLGDFPARVGPNHPNGLVLSSNGSFYGTSFTGGFRERGTVFEVTPAGKLTTLYKFCKTSDCAVGGAFPEAGLVQGVDGDFYGTAAFGGAGTGCPYSGMNCGTVFRITPDGLLTKLHDFCLQTGCPDGYEPVAALVRANDGNYYGTTSGGGANACLDNNGEDVGCGTVFRIGPGGFETLHSFCFESGCADGEYPATALLQATDGNLYGTTTLGGNANMGTIFSISTTGVFTLLYSFCPESGCADGAYPTGLIQDTDGKFYGTSSYGGTNDGGTVFSLAVGLGEFVEPEPGSGAPGAVVNLLGTALASASSVTFNGTPAIFQISSSSLITTSVPEGATSGEIEVTTPHGTIRSYAQFRITP
jgi:uncharacterized repeat protein (TIGR03803 family)